MASNDPAAQTPAEALRGSLSDLIEESKRLRVDVHGAEEARKRASRISLGVLALLCLFVLMLLAVAWQNNQLAHQVNETNLQLADCTTPGGKCYEEGRKRTSAVLADVIRAQIFMAQCARLYPNEAGPTYDRKLEHCVYERLATPAAKPSPSPSPMVSPSATPVS